MSRVVKSSTWSIILSLYMLFLISVTRFDRSDSEKYVKESHEIMQQNLNRNIPTKE